MSLQDRTLVIRNFDPERTTNKLLKELCIQGGPVRNVVVKPDHAFVEYEDVESVGYSKALLDGIEMFGRKLSMEPKNRSFTYFKYCQILQNYIQFDKQRILDLQQQQQMLALYNQQAQQTMPSPYAVNQGFQQLPPPQVTPVNNLSNQSLGSNLFNYSPITQASNQFVRAQQHLPSTSVPQGNQDFRRSRSFNQNQQHRNNQLNRSWSERGRNRARRK